MNLGKNIAEAINFLPEGVTGFMRDSWGCGCTVSAKDPANETVGQQIILRLVDPESA